MKTETTNAAVVLASLEKEARPLIKALTAIEVVDQESYAKASEKMKALKELGKSAEAKKKSLTDPLTKVITDIRDLFRPFELLIAGLEGRTKESMLLFVEKQNDKRKQIEQDLESGKIKKVSTAVRKLAELEVSAKGSQIRKVWQVVEVNAAETPIEYMVPDVAKIKEALKAGKKVKGWKWEQVETIAI